MSKFFVSLLGSLLFVSTLQAQMFADPNPATLSSQGSQKATAFQVPQMVGRFQADQQTLELMTKTASMAAQASQSNQQLFDAIFQPQANPLLVIEADLSALTLSDTYQTATIPVSVNWNDQKVQTSAQIKIRQTAQAAEFDFSMALPLSSVNLPLPAGYSDRFSDMITITMDQAALSKR